MPALTIGLKFLITVCFTSLMLEGGLSRITSLLLRITQWAQELNSLLWPIAAGILDQIGVSAPTLLLSCIIGLIVLWLDAWQESKEKHQNCDPVELGPVTHDSARWLSWLFSRFTTHIETDLIRREFRSEIFHHTAPQATNPHGTHAAHRSTGDNFINSFIRKQQRSIFSISSSPKDRWGNIRGTRYLYHEKDIRMQYQDDELRPGDIVKVVDVDYYLRRSDVADLISRSAGLMLYTLQPEHLGTVEPHFTVSSDAVVTESHVGSKPYVHKVWNWKIDYLTTVKFYWFTCIFTHSYVEYRKISDSRYVVLVTPTARGGWISYLVYSLLGSVQPLMRWSPDHHNGINILNQGENIILSVANTPIEYVVPIKIYYDSLALGPSCTNGSLQSAFNSSDQYYSLAAIFQELASISKLKLKFLPVDNRTPPSYSAVYLDVPTVQKIKIKGQQVFPPLIPDAAYIPASGKANDLACIEGRLGKLAREREGKVIKPIYYRYMDEFTDILTRFGKHKLRPWSIDEVIAHAKTAQAKKYAKAIRELLSFMGEHVYRNKAFQKTEAYDQMKEPRNISAVDPAHVAEFLRYIIPYVNYIKDHTRWYFFGLPPGELEKRLVEVVTNGSGMVIEGDFSRYDGTQTDFGVTLNAQILVYLFAEDESDNIRTLKYTLSHALFTTENKVRYNTYDTTKSGSADTSASNTTCHAFAQYCHFRNEGLQPEDAYRRIGACAGDDGILMTSNPKGYEKTCSDLLYKLKCVVRDVDEPVTFLGRVYPGLQRGDPRSFFSPFRGFSKFHLSSNSNRSEVPTILACQKLAGYIVTDKTGFVGLVARHLYKVCNVENKRIRVEYKYDTQKDSPDYVTLDILDDMIPSISLYHTNPTTLLIEVMDREGRPSWQLDPAVTYLARQLDVQPLEIVKWYTQLLEVREIEQIQPLPRRKETPERPTVSTIHYPSGVQTGPPPSKAPIPATKTQRVCRMFFNNKREPKLPQCVRAKQKKPCRWLHEAGDPPGEVLYCKNYCLDKCDRADCKYPHVPLSAMV